MQVPDSLPRRPTRVSAPSAKGAALILESLPRPPKTNKERQDDYNNRDTFARKRPPASHAKAQRNYRERCRPVPPPAPLRCNPIVRCTHKRYGESSASCVQILRGRGGARLCSECRAQLAITENSLLEPPISSHEPAVTSALPAYAAACNLACRSENINYEWFVRQQAAFRQPAPPPRPPMDVDAILQSLSCAPEAKDRLVQAATAAHAANVACRPCANPACRVSNNTIFSYESNWKCGGCRKVRYCSTKCLQTHWSAGHQVACLSEPPLSTGLAVPGGEFAYKGPCRHIPYVSSSPGKDAECEPCRTFWDNHMKARAEALRDEQLSLIPSSEFDDMPGLGL